jgi:imidazolonepropionase-like amidohydrolase
MLRCIPPSTRLPAFLADHPVATAPIALTGARVFDGTGAQVRDRATVVIADGRVTEVTYAPDAVTHAAHVIDVTGRTVMPGLIDVHAHLSMIEHSRHAPPPAKGAEPVDGIRGHLVAATLRRALRMGVTTIRDVGAYGDVVLHARQAMRYGAFAGPRLLVCGRIVSPTAPGARFFPRTYCEADGPDAMRGPRVRNCAREPTS